MVVDTLFYWPIYPYESVFFCPLRTTKDYYENVCYTSAPRKRVTYGGLVPPLRNKFDPSPTDNVDDLEKTIPCPVSHDRLHGFKGSRAAAAAMSDRCYPSACLSCPLRKGKRKCNGGDGGGGVRGHKRCYAQRASERTGGDKRWVCVIVSAVSHCLVADPSAAAVMVVRTRDVCGGGRANVGVFLDKRLTSSNNQ